MSLNELTKRHIAEYDAVVKRQEQESAKLKAEMKYEFATKGHMPALVNEYTKKMDDQKKAHAAERQKTYDRHEAEYQAYRGRNDFAKDTAKVMAAANEAMAFENEANKQKRAAEKAKEDALYKKIQAELEEEKKKASIKERIKAAMGKGSGKDFEP